MTKRKQENRPDHAPDEADAGGTGTGEDDLAGAAPEVGDDDVTNPIRIAPVDGDDPDTEANAQPPLSSGADVDPGVDTVPHEALPDAVADVTTALDGEDDAAGDEGGREENADAAAASADADSDLPLEGAAEEGGEGTDEGSEPLPAVDQSRLESILESLLFAADRPLVINELKRLLEEREGKRISEALEALRARRADSGIQLVSVAGGWQLRTHPGNGAWVAKLVAGRPTRLSRAMMETLAIVAYRQPITRPEIDEIRGVDCGPVLRTLLDRSLIRVIGKKEEVGRPMLYGTTPEFLKVFSLRDLADLPTLREFHELGADDRAKVDATAPAVDGSPSATPFAGAAVEDLRAGELPDVDPEEEDSLIEALEKATLAAGRATQSATEPETPAADAEATPGSPPASGDR